MIRTHLGNCTVPSQQRGGFGLLRVLLVMLALACVGAHAADDDPPGRVGRVIESDGTSWLYDADADEWVELQRNRPITSGNRIAVDGAARLELRVGSTSIRLVGGSEIEVSRLDDERIDLLLLSGSIALRVRSQDVSREIEIATAEGRFTPRQPGHYRIDHGDGASMATAWEGELHFDSDDSALDVGSGRSAEFWREADTTHYRWSEPQNDEFADWVARANREDDRSGVTRYVSPEMTGYEDLDRHGSWDHDDDYGALWTPTTVVTGWAPYRHGHWTWISPWGWTWIDDAPWGFAPFHYGRWVVVRGRWCWAPGRYVRRPVYAPALVAWVDDGRVHAGPPLVGWVPLAPREPYYPRYRHDVHHWRAVNRAQSNLFAPGTARSAPTQPIRYANQAAPGGLNLVPSAALVARRPVAPALVPLAPALRSDLARRTWRPAVPPSNVARGDGPRDGISTGPLRRPDGVRPLPPGAVVRRPPPEAVIGSPPPEAATIGRPPPAAATIGRPPAAAMPSPMRPRDWGPRQGSLPPSDRAGVDAPPPAPPVRRIEPSQRMQPMPPAQRAAPREQAAPQGQPAPAPLRRFEPMQRERRDPAGRGAESNGRVQLPEQRGPMPRGHAR